MTSATIATMKQIFFDVSPSPVGELLLAANADGLTHVLFAPLPTSSRLTEYWISVNDPTTHAGSPGSGMSAAVTHLRHIREQLQEYFAGTRQSFTVPLAASGTQFQRDVWNALVRIPYGQTWSYRDVAHHIGNPKAVRAVGLANGRNPISIVVPCHRVIGANGALTGYGGGIDRKRQLLSLESGVALSSDISH